MDNVTAESLWRWLREASAAEVESKILQFVRLRPSDDSRFEVINLQGTVLAEIVIPAKTRRSTNYNPGKVLTAALLRMVTCSSCKEKLLEGEVGVCGVCEARQAMDLVRLSRGLLADLDDV